MLPPAVLVRLAALSTSLCGASWPVMKPEVTGGETGVDTLRHAFVTFELNAVKNKQTTTTVDRPLTMPQLTAYEKEREENIRRNQDLLKSLGIFQSQVVPKKVSHALRYLVASSLTASA